MTTFPDYMRDCLTPPYIGIKWLIHNPYPYFDGFGWKRVEAGEVEAVTLYFYFTPKKAGSFNLIENNFSCIHSVSS